MLLLLTSIAIAIAIASNKQKHLLNSDLWLKAFKMSLIN